MTRNWWKVLLVVLWVNVVHAQVCPEGFVLQCVPSNSTKTATNTRVVNTPTVTRTSVPSRTITINKPPPPEPDTSLPVWNQLAGNAERNSNRVDYNNKWWLGTLNNCTWTVEPENTISRIQLVNHPSGLRLWEVYGVAGGYDAPNKTDPHAYPIVTRLRDLNCSVLANSGPPSTWSATFEGPWAAWWKSLTLTNYEIARFLDGGQSTATIWGSNGNNLTTGLIGTYAEEVGETVVSETKGVLCQMNRRAWHGGTRPYVACEGLTDHVRYTLWNGEGWTVSTTDPDGLVGGGIAIAEGSNRVVATLNRIRMKDTPKSGLYSWPLKGTGTMYSDENGLWSGVGISDDGMFAYAVQEGVFLVEMNLSNGFTRQIDLDSPGLSGGTNGLWPEAPVVTSKYVLVIQNSIITNSEQAVGDIVAYDRFNLKPVWRNDAEIVSNMDLLSGWQREDVTYVSCMGDSCIVAGRGGLFVLDLETGGVSKWLFDSPNAPDGFCNPQLFGNGVVVQNNFRYRGFPKCQQQHCSTIQPVGMVDYVKCCRGTTRQCQTWDSKQCQGSIGWNPNDDERFRMLSPSSQVWVLKGGMQ